MRAPMHGKVLSILVEKGANVVRGQRLAIIEAMKMEHTLTAPIDGVVADIAVAARRAGAGGRATDADRARRQVCGLKSAA